MKYILCADFGSTYTKLTAVDAADGKILGSGRAFTTIDTHVLDGFNAAKDDLKKNIGRVEFDMKIVVSSAARGQR